MHTKNASSPASLGQMLCEYKEFIEIYVYKHSFACHLIQKEMQDRENMYMKNAKSPSSFGHMPCEWKQILAYIYIALQAIWFKKKCLKNNIQ